MSSKRRSVLQAALGTSLGLLLPQSARAQTADPRNARPQEGDRLVYADGDQKGTPIKLEALSVGGPPVTAMPQDAAMFPCLVKRSIAPPTDAAPLGQSASVRPRATALGRHAYISMMLTVVGYVPDAHEEPRAALTRGQVSRTSLNRCVTSTR